MPTFTYTPLTTTSYRVSDAHSREEYGIIRRSVWACDWEYSTTDPTLWRSTGVLALNGGVGRELAAMALYRTRTAFGFEAGVL